jgi:hypothetical protein
MVAAGSMYQNNATYLQQQLEKQKQFHSANLESYKAARESYLKKVGSIFLTGSRPLLSAWKIHSLFHCTDLYHDSHWFPPFFQVEESIDFLKANGLGGAAKKAADEVSARVGEAKKLPSYFLKQVQEAVDKLLALAPVHMAVQSTKPALESAWTRYLSVHDQLVASNGYKRTYSFGQQALARAQQTFVYRKTSENLYPLVKPYAEPMLSSVTSSGAYRAVLAHLQPVSAQA